MPSVDGKRRFAPTGGRFSLECVAGISEIRTISIFILYSSYRLLIDSVNLALDAVPKNIDDN